MPQIFVPEDLIRQCAEEMRDWIENGSRVYQYLKKKRT